MQNKTHSPSSLIQHSQQIGFYTSFEAICDCKYESEGEFISDFYSPGLQNFVYLMVKRKHPPLVQQEPNPKTRDRLIKRIRQTKKVYSIRKCKQGNYHVVINSTLKPVPMMHKCLEILKNSHTSHKDTSTLIKAMCEKYDNYCLNFIKKYAFKYVMNCEGCHRNMVDKTPYWQTHTVDINQDLKQGFQNNIQISQKQDKFQDVVYDYDNCPYDCQKDHYDEYYTILLNLYSNSRGKQNYNLNFFQKKKLARDLAECKIIKCHKNTKHLWRIGYKYRCKPKNQFEHLSDFQVYKRVPMENEKIIVAKVLHGEKHRKYLKMIQAAPKLPFVFNIIKEFIQNNHIYCQTCPHLQKLKTQYSTVPKQNEDKFQKFKSEDISDEEEEKKKQKLPQKFVFISKKQALNREWIKKLKLIKRVQKIQSSTTFTGLLIQTHISENQSPNVIVTSSVKLQANYHAYGDCVYFQTFSHFIDTKECWQTYFFSGVDEQRNQVIFGAAMIDKPSFQAFFYAFKMFFQLMYNEYPETICTPFDLKISQAISSLTYYSQQEKLRNIRHFYLWKSTVSVFNQMLSAQNQPAGLISRIIEAIRTPSEKKYIQIMNFLKNELGKDSKLFLTLSEEKERLFWTQFPPSFVGFMLDYIRTENVLKTLKQHLSICTTSMQFLNDFWRINSKKKLKKGYYQVNMNKTTYSIPELQSLTGLLSFRIAQQLAQRFIMSHKITSVTHINELQLVVQQEFGKFNLEYDLQNDHWVCSCWQLQKTGLPCSHLIKIIKQMGGNIKYYVNQRWLLQHQNQNEELIAGLEVQESNVQEFKQQENQYQYDYRLI